MNADARIPRHLLFEHRLLRAEFGYFGGARLDFGHQLDELGLALDPHALQRGHGLRCVERRRVGYGRRTSQQQDE